MFRTHFLSYKPNCSLPLSGCLEDGCCIAVGCMEAPARTVFAIDVDGVPECPFGASLPRSCIFAIQYGAQLFIFSGHR